MSCLVMNNLFQQTVWDSNIFEKYKFWLSKARPMVSEVKTGMMG
jgi:hypothetical protein